jgi:hypothetical protein
MAKIGDMQKQHEAKVDELVRSLSGRGRESDWALVRALIHRAVHVNAERKAGEFCAIATYLAEQLGHAHTLLHGADKPDSAHDDFLH